MTTNDSDAGPVVGESATPTANSEAVEFGSNETEPPPDGQAEKSSQRKARVTRSFPASSFSEALTLATAIQKHAAGQPVRRLTLFDKMGRSPSSGPSRQLVTNSSAYGITKGSYQSEWLELTEQGKLASSEDVPARTQISARLELAVKGIAPFFALYERYKGNRAPTTAVMKDFVTEQGMAESLAEECVETFLANVRDLGLLRTSAGAERLLTFEMLLDEQAAVRKDDVPQSNEGRRDSAVLDESASVARVPSTTSDISDVCFLVSPIGSEDSEQRKHANLVLGSLLEPALEGLGLRLVRADQISKPGMITAQVIEHIVQAPLVIADLSFGNPNVYYELALRHACRKPAVQLIRSADRIPFDVGQFRTVVIDMTDIYTLVPQIDTHRAEIARQCRAALNSDGAPDSPLSLFYPQFWG